MIRHQSTIITDIECINDFKMPSMEYKLMSNAGKWDIQTMQHCDDEDNIEELPNAASDLFDDEEEERQKEERKHNKNTGNGFIVENGFVYMQDGHRPTRPVLQQEQEPEEEEYQKDLGNFNQTLMNLLNGFVGAGILSMPMAFRNGGLWLMLVCTPLVASLSAASVHRLLAINQLAIRNGEPCLSYPEMAEYAFKIGPQFLRPCSTVAKQVAFFMVIAAQIGGCSVYFSFIVNNLEKAIDKLLDYVNNQFTCNMEFSHTIYLLSVLVFLSLLNQIRNVKQLSNMSFISNMIQLLGLSIILYNYINRPWMSAFRLPAVGDKIMQALVMTLFICDGTSVSTTLYSKMRNRHNFTKPLGVVNVGLSIVAIAYMLVGFFGYIQYGDQVKGSITLNLPSELLYDFLMLLYAIAVSITYPLAILVPIQIIWPYVTVWARTKPQLKSWVFIVETIFRILMVVLTFILAATIPKLELIISLVGSVTSSTITLSLPAVLNMVAFWHQTKGWSRIRMVTINIFFLSLGISAFWFGFFDSWKEFQMSTSIKSIEIPYQGLSMHLNDTTTNVARSADAQQQQYQHMRQLVSEKQNLTLN